MKNLFSGENLKIFQYAVPRKLSVNSSVYTWTVNSIVIKEKQSYLVSK